MRRRRAGFGQNGGGDRAPTSRKGPILARPPPPTRATRGGRAPRSPPDGRKPAHRLPCGRSRSHPPRPRPPGPGAPAHPLRRVRSAEPGSGAGCARRRRPAFRAARGGVAVLAPHPCVAPPVEAEPDEGTRAREDENKTPAGGPSPEAVPCWPLDSKLSPAWLLRRSTGAPRAAVAVAFVPASPFGWLAGSPPRSRGLVPHSELSGKFAAARKAHRAKAPALDKIFVTVAPCCRSSKKSR